MSNNIFNKCVWPGRRELPGFSKNVIHDEEAACCLRSLHELVMKGSCEFSKEENLLLLLSLLIQQYGQPLESGIPECRDETERRHAIQLFKNIRIGEAKKLLEQGVPPIEAALQTGFSDQSHLFIRGEEKLRAVCHCYDKCRLSG